MKAKGNWGDTIVPATDSRQRRVTNKACPWTHAGSSVAILALLAGCALNHGEEEKAADSALTPGLTEVRITTNSLGKVNRRIDGPTSVVLTGFPARSIKAETISDPLSKTRRTG